MLSFYYIKYLNSGGRLMKYRRQLFSVKDPYSDSSDELFTKAVKKIPPTAFPIATTTAEYAKILVYPLPRMRPNFP